MNNSISILPIGLFAYANPKNDLDRLINEQKTIRKIFDKAENKGVCDFLERPAVDFSTLIDTFQNSRYSERIFIFHFGGHAGDYELLLTDSKINAKPFNNFISVIQSLKLVFLNGCSTKNQGEDLRKLKLPAVIATSQDVPDDSGTFFAGVFYNGLVEGYTIYEAFNQAKDTTCSKFDNCYEVQQGLSDPRKPNLAPQFLWKLYLEDEAAGEWKIENDLNNPYFGLPKPAKFSLPTDPYISLKPYTEKETGIFWGRGNEIKDLYIKAIDENANPLILVYGQTGVGKSSLLDAGLVPRLRITSNLFFCKRLPDLGLSGTLQKALSLNSNSADVFIQEIESLNQASDKKQVIIIVDQVEELFTKPLQHLQNELTDFICLINKILLSSVNVKFILGYRKEFHAELESEIASNQIPFSSYFLQALNRDNIIEIVNGSKLNKTSKNQYNIDIEKGLDEQIADDLSRDIDSPIAPVLQILLTNLWKSCKVENNKHIFSRQQYYILKDNGIALNDFVSARIKDIEYWNKDIVQSGLLLDLLYFHTTTLGTSATHSIIEINERYKHISSINSIIQKCKDLYLLVDTAGYENQVSLSHDTLAPIIKSIFESSLRPGQRALRILINQDTYLNEANELLSLNERDLSTVENGISGMRELSNREKNLITISKVERKKDQRRKKILNIIGIVAIVIVIVSLGIALNLYFNSIKEANKSKALYLSSEASKILKNDPTQALHLLIAADSLLPNDEGILQNIYSVYNSAKTNPFYQKDIYTDLISPEFELSHDKKHLILYNSPSDNKDKTKAYLTDIDGNPLSILKYNDKYIEQIAFNPTRKEIITLFNNYSLDDTTDSDIVKIIIIYDYSGTIINKLEYKNDVLGFVVSKDGDNLLTSEVHYTSKGNEKYFIVQRKMSSGKEIKRFEVGEGGADTFCWHPTENKLLFSTYDSVLCLNLTDGSRVSKYLKNPTEVAFSPNGEYFAAGSSGTMGRDAPLKGVLWKIDGKWIADLPHTAYVWSVSFSKNSDLVLTSSWDDTVKVWGIDGRLHKAIDNKARAWFSYLYKNKIITISKDRAGISVYDTVGNFLSVIEAGKGIEKSDFYNDSVLISGTVNHIKFWNLNSQEALEKGYWLIKQNSLIRMNNSLLKIDNENINFDSASNQRLFDVIPFAKGIAIFKGSVHFLERDTKTGNVNKELSDTSFVSIFINGRINKSFSIPGFSIKSALKKEDSGQFLVTCSDGIARIIDLNGKILSVFITKIPYHSEIDKITHAEFVKSNNTIITYTSVGYIIFWNEKGQKLKTLDFFIPKNKLPTKQGYSQGYGSLSLSQDEKIIAAFPGESFVFIYDPFQKRVDTIYYNKEGDIHSLIHLGKLIHNGKYLITQNNYGIDIWSLKTKAKIVHVDCNPINFYVSKDEKRLLVNQQKGNSFIYLLPHGITDWIKMIRIAPLSKENRIKYEIQ